MAKATTKAAKPADTSPSTAVANVSSTGSAIANPDMLSAFDGMGSGLENVTAKDLLIPRLTIIQGLSPQVTQGKPEFDPNAKVGMIYDVGLQEGFPGALTIIPVHYVKQYLEWAPRNTGKGLIAIHDDPDILEQTTLDEKRRNVLPNGNYVQETAQFYIMNLNAGMRKSFIPMTSTQLKKARRLLTLATDERLTRPDGSEFVPPLFYRTYVLSTVPESNAEGNWMGWKIERGAALDELPGWQKLMVEIKNFRDSLTSGDIKADIASMREEVERTIDGDASSSGRM